MPAFTTLLILLVVVTALVAASGRLQVPHPLLLVLGGLVLAFLPLPTRLHLEPEFVFDVFLPPLLYQSAWLSSWHEFRARIRPIALMAVLLVLVTIGAVAGVAHALLGMSWAVAFVLGGIVSPTDSVAPVSVVRRLGAPRRLVTVVEGESLLNDATGLVAYRLAVAAVVTGAFSLPRAGATFVVGAAGGLLVGLAVGWAVARVHRHMDSPSIETTLTLLTPYIAWMAGEALALSGVLAVVSAGLYVSRQSSRAFAARLRLQTVPVWQTLGFLLESLLFILLGLELREVLATVGAQREWGPLLGAVVLLGLVLTGVRLLWLFPQAWLPRRLSPQLRERDPMPPWQEVLVVGWMGMRGAVSMAAALALPLTTASGAPFPERERLLFLTYGVILWTLLLQGLTLPALIRRLGLHDDGLARREELVARIAAADAALARIDALLAERETAPELLQAMRRRQENTLRALRQHLPGAKAPPADVAGHRLLTESQQQLIEQVLEAQRQALLQLREEGSIHDEVLHRLERELDLEEERLHLAAHLGGEGSHLV